MAASVISVIYHYEGPEQWWIESPEYPEYTAFGQSRSEVTSLARDGLRFVADDPGLVIVGLDPLDAPTGSISPRVFRISVEGFVARINPPTADVTTPTGTLSAA